MTAYRVGKAALTGASGLYAEWLAAKRATELASRFSSDPERISVLKSVINREILGADNRKCNSYWWQGFRTMNNVKIILGEEFDNTLKKRLLATIKALGGKILSAESGVGGSQEFSEVTADIDGTRITIESETYVGLSISGPETIVQKICACVSNHPH